MLDSVRFPAPALYVLAALAGCATPARQLPTSEGPPAALLAGDIVVGIHSTDPRVAGEGRIVRYRRVEDEAGHRIEGRTLLTADGVPRDVRLAADGAWLAAAVERDGDLRTSLWRVRPDGRPDPAWDSPAGCAAPAFDPESRFLLVACPAVGRQPAWLLRLSLPALQPLALVGERDRIAPVVGVEGDVYWVEEDASGHAVVRRPDSGGSYVTHRLVDPVESIHPRLDGSHTVTLRVPSGGLELADLLPGGSVRLRSLPASLGVGSPEKLTANPEGDLLAIRCARGDCAIVEATADGEPHAPLSVSGRPTSIAYVPSLRHRVTRPEDLATAPASVFRHANANEVGVLGVRIGMSLETAFSHLEQAGLHPWWSAPPGPRSRPRSIGIGRGAGSWCVEYLADERGTVAAMDLRDCAAPYLSPEVRPLLDGRNLGPRPLVTVQRFLGPGVSMEVGDGAGSPGETRHQPLRRTTLQFDAPERGYHYVSETESIEAAPWMGRAWLRLQEPGKRQAILRP